MAIVRTSDHPELVQHGILGCGWVQVDADDDAAGTAEILEGLGLVDIDGSAAATSDLDDAVGVGSESLRDTEERHLVVGVTAAVVEQLSPAERCLAHGAIPFTVQADD